MTIKSSLHMSIAIVKAFSLFLVQNLASSNFLSPVENWPKISVLGEMGSKYKIVFLRPPKDTPLRGKSPD